MKRIGPFSLSDKSRVYRRVILLMFILVTTISIVWGQDGGRTYTKPKKSNKAEPPKNPAIPKNGNKTRSLDHPAHHNNNPSHPKPIKVLIPSLVHIAGGSYFMGSTHRPNEQPIHKIELDSFEMGACEVSNQEFEAFVVATNYQTQAELANNQITWRSYFEAGRENYPVVCVSWTDAVAFCKWLSTVTGDNYRLPTEAEWEFAARGGLADKDYPWGNEINEEQANFDIDGSNTLYAGVALELLEPINNYQANGYGIYNIAGNVWEWCQDWYEDTYYAKSPSTNPIGPEKGLFKIMRGGSWVNDGNTCRVSYRNFNSTNYSMPFLGFRIVKTTR